MPADLLMLLILLALAGPSFAYVVAFAIAMLVIAYLFVALLFPERF